jgi:hypothetical protein
LEANPGLRPWAILFSHFVAIADTPVRLFALSPIRPFVMLFPYDDPSRCN